MIAKRLRESLDSSICIRDIFEEGKKLAEVYGAENIYNFSIGNPSVEPPAIGTSGGQTSCCTASEWKIWMQL